MPGVFLHDEVRAAPGGAVGGPAWPLSSQWHEADEAVPLPSIPIPCHDFLEPEELQKHVSWGTAHKLAQQKQSEVTGVQLEGFVPY